MRLPFSPRPYLALGLAAALGAQDADFAEKLFRSGERAYAAKSYKEALDTWNQLLGAAPRSDFAPQAALRIAQHLADVDGKPDAAMPYLDRLKTEYLRTPWAAQGLLLRGTLLARRARKPEELKDAVAEFNRVLDLFPDSPAVPEARYQLGLAALGTGQLNKALGYFVETFRAHPDSAIAPEAMVQAAAALDASGDLEGALRLLQRVRNTAPGSPAADEAGWRLTTLVRHRLLKAPLKVEGPWPAGKVKWLHTPTLLAMDAQGGLLIYQSDLNQAFALKANEAVAASGSLPSARVLLAAPSGPWLFSKNSLVKGEAAPAPVAGLNAITGAFLDRWGSLWVSDAKAPNLTVIGPDGLTRAVAAPTFNALAPLPQGMAGASDDTRTLILMDAEGKEKQKLPYGQGLPAPFKEILALASDPLGHLAAIVDGGEFGEGVVVYDAKGAVLRQASFKSLGLAGRFTSLVLDRSGGIILCDRRNDILVRLF
ncbi:MAG TPA: tetratricopeptide repeat protein [Holophagaceae bacterium]|nr:tetratricopeptide repeat protein [Holophagaceae bacterium]